VILKILPICLAITYISTRPALAQAECSGFHPLAVEAAFQPGAPGTTHVWGRENVQPAGNAAVRILYPAGSINPGNKAAPVGGAGFEQTLSHGATTGCLRYQVRFAPDFDFVKGGKLPGLFGGEAPRGCIPDGEASGFSARLMWREGGAGELYLYAPGRETRCGQSIGRGRWHFVPGAWTDITEQVTLNTPGQSDGAIRIWVNGAKMVEADGLTLRGSDAVGVDGLLFSTFFGGKDPSWAPAKPQSAEFRNFGVALATSVP
jgi:hypothetical protein